jgi:membrane peptidoglycan carboxypeptidase
MARMLEKTVTSGTARRVFRERGFRVDDAVGKTGTLADKSPFRDYSWFVGYAPKDNPRVAVAAVVVNDPYWRIRATWLGREAMRLALERVPIPDPAPAGPAVAETPGSAPVLTAPAGQAPEGPDGEDSEEALEDAPPTALPTATGAASPP